MTNLVHMVVDKFNKDANTILGILYKTYYSDWKKMDVIHLLIGHHELGRSLNETTIEEFNYTYGEICRDVLTRIQPYLDNNRIKS